MSKNRAKFVELAEKRVQKTIKSMRLIGNLSNKTNYSYEDADLKKIFTTLKKELEIEVLKNKLNIIKIFFN